MFVDPEIVAAAADFWHGNDPTETVLPRDVESLLWAIQLECVAIADLDIQKALAWLQERKLVLPKRVRGQQRPIFGCLVAARDRGYIFVDSNASEQERRFTVAHETGHFLFDYKKPRQAAVQALGGSIIPVLDGQRKPTETERIHAILSSTKLNVFVDLLLRGPNNQIISNETTKAEVRADQVALELLAPYRDVLRRAKILHSSLSAEQIQARTKPLLTDEYGLPGSVAVEYSTRLANYYERRETVREWLGL